ncbi:hypothetical protein LER27_13895 [Pseudomonas aeruginosa]|uniref:hypothetical protein n=1 Tax=Pseudomonas aeruginosa TaxID=287 RepID=UPI001A1B1780|nr:hypothetical protein [Pseudomonas aeruginosa]MBI7354306.1 hypothetical protein [Pseudomonas aeruginosa]MBI8948671.1 hypothetical protein [Pseudomonas aeruginosa]MDU0538051.1 hypothetical protein [Pseudomonas aeruginosa]HEJ4043551.1 hypothetical protein [Pseudomonas aeruginosa]HEJ5767228.1 hypothetical protein [Pseudomonas aeruginosa]
MSAAINCINDLKYLARQFKDDGMTYCQRLDHLSRKIGFNNRHHIEKVLSNLTDDQIGKISTKLMRLACAKALPKPNRAYFEFIAQRGRNMRFYSSWAGWDKRGQEVRVPRGLDGFYSVPRLREQLTAPVYVIETDRQLVAWRNKWHGMAYVPAALAREHMKEAFARYEAVVKGPRNEAFDLEEDFNSNYATWYPVGA